MYTQIATPQIITAHRMIPSPRLFPITLVVLLVEEAIVSSINSTPEKEQPGTECEQHPETRVHQRKGAEVSFDLRPNEDSTQQQHADHAQANAEHPGRKE
jgi:hypothetical protein